MPIQHSLWVVGNPPLQVQTSKLASENSLEDMIDANPYILSGEWMLVGRQVAVEAGGYIDLLAITSDASLVLIELKKDKTPRDVIAQILDYASWIIGLGFEEIEEIYRQYKQDKSASLSQDFHERFDCDLDKETINDTHELVVVASSIDPRTERIVKYLEDRKIPINVLFFDVFKHEDTQFISRAWLLDPERVKPNATAQEKKEPWNREFYVSFGHGEERNWDEAVKYGFISAGGGTWYSKTLNLLRKDARIWVKSPKHGFVGVGRVTGTRQSLAEFEVEGSPADEKLKGANYHKQFKDSTDKTEYFVPVKWLQTVPIGNAIHEVGMFGNQNTVCKPVAPRWRTTVDRLKKNFPKYDQDDTSG